MVTPVLPRFARLDNPTITHISGALNVVTDPDEQPFNSSPKTPLRELLFLAKGSLTNPSIASTIIPAFAKNHKC